MISSIICTSWYCPREKKSFMLYLRIISLIMNMDIRTPIGHSGRCLEANFHIITGQIAAAKNIDKCVAKAGLQISDLILEPLASAEAVLSAKKRKQE
jgi:cell division ATPase FtsA